MHFRPHLVIISGEFGPLNYAVSGCLGGYACHTRDPTNPRGFGWVWIQDGLDMVELLQVLLAKGADPDNIDAERPLKSLLNWYFDQRTDITLGSKVLQCAQILINLTDDPDIMCSIGDWIRPNNVDEHAWWEMGVIHQLIEIGLDETWAERLDVVKALIGLFAESSSNQTIVQTTDPNHSHNQLTPLLRVCLLGWTECIPWFARGTANFNVKGPQGETPLHIASKSGNEAMIQALLNGGAKVGRVSHSTL